MATKTKKPDIDITAEDLASKVPSDLKLNIAGTEVNTYPMNYPSAKRFAKVIGKLTQKMAQIKWEADDSEKKKAGKPDLSVVLESIRDLITGSLDMEWLDVLPELVKIISDGYQLGYTQAKIEEQMCIGQMLEVIILQWETEKKASSVAYDFFMRILKKLPGIDKLTTLLLVISQFMDSLSLPLSTSLPSDTEPSPLQ